MIYFSLICVVLYLMITALWYYMLQKQGNHMWISCVVASFLWLPTIVVGQIMELWHDKMGKS